MEKKLIQEVHLLSWKVTVLVAAVADLQDRMTELDGRLGNEQIKDILEKQKE